VVLDRAGGGTLVPCFECVKPGGAVVSINSSTPSPALAQRRGPNPVLVFAIKVLSRKTLAAARKHKARYEYFFVQGCELFHALLLCAERLGGAEDRPDVGEHAAAFQVGKARTSDQGPSSWIPRRRPRATRSRAMR
jgi:hypothetical protein